MRVNQYLARCGLASRRKAEALVIGGSVRVNGTVIRDLATVINEGDKVEVDGKAVTAAAENVYIVMNKPRAVVTTCDEQFGRRTVMDVLQEGMKGTGGRARVFPVGRLDYDTEGLLVLTSDGDFARKITHPSCRVPKTYVAKLDVKLTEGDLDKLRQGVEISPEARGALTVAAESVRFIGQYEVEIVIREGKNRQVRKMFAAVGAQVLRLRRIAIGKLTLGNLRPGEWKYIKDLPKKI